MSPYHQGPPFPVTSSPILPLDVQPSRTKRPSPLSLLPFTDYPHRFSTPSGVGSGGFHSDGFPPDSPRSVPSEWTGDAVCPDSSDLSPQYTQNIADSAGIASNSLYPPSRPLTSTPAGWDSDPPMNLMSYGPLTQGSESGTTLFYRSPTPSARQRTNQACEKCRDRKTKVSIVCHVMCHHQPELHNPCSAAVDVRPVFGVKLGDSFANMQLNTVFVAQRKRESGPCHPSISPRLPLQLEHHSFITHMPLPRTWGILGGTCNQYHPRLEK